LRTWVVLQFILSCIADFVHAKTWAPKDLGNPHGSVTANDSE